MIYCKTCNTIYFNYFRVSVLEVDCLDNLFKINKEDVDKLNPEELFDVDELHELQNKWYDYYEDKYYLCPNESALPYKERNLHDTERYVKIKELIDWSDEVVTNGDISNLLKLKSFATNKEKSMIELDKLTTERLMEVKQILDGLEKFKEE